MSIYRFQNRKLDSFEHGFFTRLGGISIGIFEGLNCGTGSKDDHKNVQFNRNLVAAEMNVNPQDLITVHQEHSARVVVVDSPLEVLTKADAIVTNTPNLSIGVLTADCLPVLFADKKNHVIGVAHAGWKGALNGILENKASIQVGIMNQFSDFPFATPGAFITVGKSNSFTIMAGGSGASIAMRHDFLND